MNSRSGRVVLVMDISSLSAVYTIRVTMSISKDVEYGILGLTETHGCNSNPSGKQIGPRNAASPSRGINVEHVHIHTIRRD